MSPRARALSYVAALAAALTVAAVAYVLDSSEQERYRGEQRAEVLHRASAVRARIEAALNSRLFLSRALAAFAATEPELVDAEFQVFARTLVSERAHVRAVALARDAVIDHIYPPEDNQRYLGVDLTEVEGEADAVARALETGKTVVAGPVVPGSGVPVLISHTPIVPFAWGEPEIGRPRYWGLALVVVDAERFFEEAGLTETTDGIEFALRGRDGRGTAGDVIRGSPELFAPERDPLVLEVALPTGFWVLGALPEGGWAKSAPGSFGWRFGGTILSACAALLALIVVQSPARLRAAVEAATQAHRAAEAKYRGIFENAQEGIFQSGPDGRFVGANPALARMLGYESPERMIATVGDIAGEIYVDAERRAEFRRRADADGGVTDFESQVRRRDGEIIWVRENTRTVRDAEGRLVCYEGVVADITETKRALEALRRSEEELRARAESLRAVNAVAERLHRSLDLGEVAELALDGVVAYAKPKAGSLFEHDPQSGTLRLLAHRGPELRDLPVGSTLPVADSFTGLAVRGAKLERTDDVANESRLPERGRAAMTELGLRAMASIPLIHQDRVQGALNLLFEATPDFTEQEWETLVSLGRTIGMAMSNARYVDRIEAEIAERARAEKALVESEARYRALSELTSDFAYAFRIETDGTMINEWATGAFAKITGYEIDEVDRLGWDNIVHPDDTAVATRRIRRLLKLEPDTTDLRIVTKSGEIRWLRDMSRPERDPETGAIRVLGAARDITDRLVAEREKSELEARLVQSQKMEAIGNLAGGVAHDFNNLLTGILGYASVLKAEATPGDRVHKAADVIEKAADRASQLTRQLLGFARRGKLQEVSVNLHDTIVEVVALLKRTVEKHILIEQTLEADSPYVRGDPGQLQQVVLNLAVNARDAMPQGGSLRVKTGRRRLTPDEARQAGVKVGDFVVLSVSDTGYGMPKEVLDRVFEPFFTTKDQGKGTGMGLAMVYGIVQNHGGFVTVESEVGRGTTFDVHLPADQGAPVVPTAEPERPVHGSGRVLIVDDEPVVRELATDMLTRLGYETIVASNGREALDVFRERRDEIDLVILDMVMPEMGGRETFVEMKRMKPGVKAILSTGYARDGAAQEILDSGMLGFVQKPYRMAALSEVVAKALGTPTGAGKG